MLSFPTISPAQAITSLRLQDVAGLSPAAAPVTPGVSDLTPATGPIELRPSQTGDSFATMLGRMIDDVSAKQGAAVDAVGALQSGQNVPLHQAVIAMEEANVSFQLMVEVRNKLLDSYQELMRMQI
ncbi:MAG: flagellar hook-basal body complex protein FliE [Limisphaerales bacterium]